MNNYVYYYRFNHQFFGTRFSGENAREAAELLDFRYKEIFINNREQLNGIKIYKNNLILIEDMLISYPGITTEEILILYKLREPLQGEKKYYQLAIEQPDYIETYYYNLSFLKYSRDKYIQVENMNSKIRSGCFIAYRKKEPVAVIEFIRESDCLFSLPERNEKRLFITFLYNFKNQYYDYRPFLIYKIIKSAYLGGYKALSIISGLRTDNLNGPVKFLEDLNFTVTKKLDRVLLKYTWEDLFFMTYDL
ncbi:MAG: hypothetical protein ACOC4G_07535 [Bacillota bacterium]